MIKETGISLLEVLISVAILSGALVVVYRPLLTSLSALQEADSRLEADHLLHNHLWEWKRHLREEGSVKSLREVSPLIGRHQGYEASLTLHSVSDDERLKQMDVMLEWPIGAKKKKKAYTYYQLLPDEKTE